MDDIIYITPENSNFYRCSGGFLGLKFNGEDLKRVSLSKAFPFSHSSCYISVKGKDNKEIGLIQDISAFSLETLSLFTEELERRYLLPLISRINSVKEEFGYAYWDVETDIGAKRFIIRKDNNSFIPLSENRVLVVDVDGNRFEIPDYTKLDSKSYRIIELMI